VDELKFSARVITGVFLFSAGFEIVRRRDLFLLSRYWITYVFDPFAVTFKPKPGKAESQTNVSFAGGLKPSTTVFVNLTVGIRGPFNHKLDRGPVRFKGCLLVSSQ
jgi:hypothetical protein